MTMADTGPTLCSVLDPSKSRCRVLFALHFLSIATNPLTRSPLLQMLGSTRKGYTPKAGSLRAGADHALHLTPRLTSDNNNPSPF
ncbi:hypothetical protein KGM_209443 [Danaus plexippus plexippus]|uniref:Uncharacterized protein n=1 Tax=Danaus plexippus plexippus TaxID=278856 RepID=A0A212F685_DANPL|nr:hypothetical protein KGM_209443 [Danaus plexippus plexippus]